MDMSFTTPPPSQPVPSQMQSPPQTMDSTLGSTGMGSTGRPFIPQLWDPQPRSDGFPASGWEAPYSVSSRGITDSQPASMRVPEQAPYVSEPMYDYGSYVEEQPDLDVFGLPVDETPDDNVVPVFVPSSRSMDVDRATPKY